MKADARAKKILFAAFRTKNGVATPIAAADRAYAKSKGYMFEPITITHDALRAQLAKLVTPSGAARASGAFLASLSSHRLDWRCGLANYVIAASVKRHRFAGARGCDDPTCMCTSEFCKDCNGLVKYENADLDGESFQRHRGFFGSRGDPLFQLHDLSELSRDSPTPVAEDVAIFDAILAAIDKAPAAESATKLVARLEGVLPSTKSERASLLEILGASGVLVAKKQRKGPDTDWHYVDDWRGEDGYDRAAVKRLFGMHRKPRRAASLRAAEGERALPRPGRGTPTRPPAEASVVALPAPAVSDD